jgi:hypothetical protein
MMKRLLIASFVLIALTASVSAQELSRSYLGFKGGVNYVTLKGDSLENMDNLTGYAFGAFYQYRLHPRFAISPEVYYSLKGAKNSEEDIKLELGYIDIPVLFKLMFPTESTVTPCVYAGGYYSFLMSAKVDDYDVKDLVAGADYGVLLGASVDLALKEGRQLVNIDVRYTLGLANINEDPEDTDEFTNAGFQFLLGWGFNL